jgi:hypothetical protein
MSTPNIAKADIIEGFKYRHATKEFDPTKLFLTMICSLF